MLFLSKWDIILEVIICSKTLQQMHVRDIGRLFSAFDFGPFLYTGVTNAFFQSVGTVPSATEEV